MNDDAEPVHVDPFDLSDDHPRRDGAAMPAEGADDCFAPPEEPCECYCLHCGRTFMSTGIWLQRIRNPRPGHLEGFWMCPTPNCDGKGFTFDIFPTDPDHPANEGWSYDDDDEEEFDWEEDFELDIEDDFAEAEYDPHETKWKQLDDELAGEEYDDDIEGEEWKYGLEPGERLPEPHWSAESRRECEQDQARYDAPDERPREIDWDPPGGDFNEDDIPF